MKSAINWVRDRARLRDVARRARRRRAKEPSALVASQPTGEGAAGGRWGGVAENLLGIKLSSP